MKIDTNNITNCTEPPIAGMQCYNQPFLSFCRADSILKMKEIESKSVDCILTDPPYKYLKNQKLEIDFDETIFFNEAKRVLKPDGFIVLFGRGTSFYRWNTMLSQLGFTFKEEIIWDKSHCTSPLMNISRVHETISIHTKGKGAINKSKIPYLEMKSNDLQSIVQDIKRMRSIFSHSESMKAVLDFLENNTRDKSDKWQANNLSISSEITKEDRCVSVARSIKDGFNEKTIIRNYKDNLTIKNNPNARTGLMDRDRCEKVVQGIEIGLNEKTIIKQIRDHYSAIHPTQKPIRLLERLLAITTNEGDMVLDPFAGSCSTGIACLNMKRKFIGYEIDLEYYQKAVERIKSIEPRLF